MFADVPGQQLAKSYFAGVLERGPGHAYLLAGPEGLGKRAFALELAGALVTSCGGCGTCDACERVRRAVHPDLAIVEREGEFIRIEQVQRVIADLRLKPFAATRRVWVVFEPERFNVQAANTFLKSLEEPPSHVHFILVSDAPERVLPTIVSRCQVVDFRPVADDELAAFLHTRQGLATDDADIYGRLARGSIGRALRLVDDARGAQYRRRYLRLAAGVALHDREAERRFVDAVLEAEEAATEKVAAQAAERREALERIVQDSTERDWRLKALEGQARRETQRVSRLACLDAVDHLIAWLRDIWAVGLDGEEAVWNRDRLDELRHAAVARPELYARLLGVVGGTRKDLFLNVDRELALRAMFARFEEVWEGA